ncbi:Ribonuclease H-like protein [Mycena sanguinolenta]|uniref:Ribonuclease H-like protein n=1 Tax=Mycena sanguinolenta TaxID=230812 RepID=A0A8H7D3T2_9AGAR|nr:Ribonuclease H-like protein [Mycena sanguinolenta]
MLIAAIDWAVILREMADSVPHLAELIILGIRMPTPALIHSLARYHALKKLTTDSTPDFVFEPSFRTIAPTEKVGYAPEMYPALRVSALESLSVRLELLELNSPKIALLLQSLIRRLPKSRSLKSSVPLLLDVRANISPEALMCRMMDAAQAQAVHWEKTFGGIEHLRVRDYGAHSCLVLARWVALFRGMTDILLAGMSGSQASLRRTVAEIHRICANVRTVTIEGMTELSADTYMELDGGPRTFLELPDDVLLDIFSHLAAPDLYNLSRLSRRLHLLSLPVYFVKKGSPDPSNLCEFWLANHVTAGDVLSAFSSALFLRTVKQISCHFKPGGYISCYLHHLERLTAFLSKFPSVQNVSLTLIAWNTDSEVNEAVHVQWRTTFAKLLDVIVREKSCQELTIHGPPYLTPCLSELPWPKLQATPSRRAHTAKTYPLRAFSFHPTVNTKSRAGILWVFNSALRGTQITRLSVTVSSQDLLEIIAQELPTLPELDIVSHRDDVGLLQLLCKLQCLTYLALPATGVQNSRVPLQKSELVPTFQCLRTLAAPPPFIMFFFAADRPLPALECLEIRASSMFSPPHTILPFVLKPLLTLNEKRRAGGTLPSVSLELGLTHRHAIKLIAWLRADSSGKLGIGDKSWADTAELVHGLTLRGVTSGGKNQPGRADKDVLKALRRLFPELRESKVCDESGGRSVECVCSACVNYTP